MAWLRDTIERQGLTVRRVANTLDVSTATVYDWDTGKMRPRDRHAARLAELLDIDEYEVRRALGLWIPQPIVIRTEDQGRLYVAGILRRITELEEQATTERERWILDQLREVVRAPEHDEGR